MGGLLEAFATICMLVIVAVCWCIWWVFVICVVVIVLVAVFMMFCGDRLIKHWKRSESTWRAHRAEYA